MSSRVVARYAALNGPSWWPARWLSRELLDGSCIHSCMRTVSLSTSVQRSTMTKQDARPVSAPCAVRLRLAAQPPTPARGAGARPQRARHGAHHVPSMRPVCAPCLCALFVRPVCAPCLPSHVPSHVLTADHQPICAQNSAAIQFMGMLPVQMQPSPFRLPHALHLGQLDCLRDRKVLELIDALG